MSETVHPANVGEKFGQITVTAAGKPLVREIEIVQAPTLSRRGRYVIIRNDAHPHRVGKRGLISRAELARKYRAVES